MRTSPKSGATSREVCRCGARTFPHRRDRGCAALAADQAAGWGSESKQEVDLQELYLFDRNEARAINADIR